MFVSNESPNEARRVILSIRVTHGADGPFYQIDAESEFGRLSVFDRNREVALARIFAAMRDAWVSPGDGSAPEPVDA